MKSLKTFFENPLLKDDEISIEKFKKFSEDHLARITVSANAAVSSLVAATGSAHLAYFGSIGDVATASAVQQSRTKAVDAKLHEFTALVRKEEPGIAYALGGREAAEYQEFFPHGLTEYSEATKANVETLMERFETAAKKYQTTVRSTLHTDMVTLRTAYGTLRGSQLGQKGTKDTERGERDAARAALAHQLWTNLLTIALAYIDRPDEGLAYFDEGILK